MKKTILACALLSMAMPIVANEYQATVKNFNLNYNFPSGTANSQELIYKNYQYYGATGYNVELQAGVLLLETPDDIIHLDNLPDSITEVNALTISGLNLTSNSQLVALEANRLATQSTDSSIDIRNFAIDCDYEDIDEELMQEVLHSCFNVGGNIDLGSFISNGSEVISNTEFSLNRNNMDFEMKAQGLKIKGNGKTYYENNQIRIRIDKAKVGFINVRGRLFKELEKLESDKVQVNEPWIEFSL